jgi:hypothetical protein
MAAINAYVSDRLKDQVIEAKKEHERSLSWVVVQALELWLALQSRYDCGPIDRHTVFQALELWLQIQPVPIIGTISADMTADDWARIIERIEALKERRE